MKMLTKTNCMFCGGRLIEKYIEGRDRKYCPHCNTPIYENPVPAACSLVTDTANKVLLIKRRVEPAIGKWCLPGGFVELDESPEAAAVRELQEETGLHGKLDFLLGVATDPNPFYGTVMIVCYCIKKYSGLLVAGDDALEAGFFESDALPEIAFDSHRHFIRNYYTTFSIK